MHEIDFHCHLDDDSFDADRAGAVTECFEAGFSALVTVADPYDADSESRSLEALAGHPRVFLMAAAHPHNADRYTPEVEQRLMRLLDHPRAIGLGEAGLDFYYDLSLRENQLRVFERQIAIAAERGLPLVIHSRRAEALVLETLERMKFSGHVVFHCYTGEPAAAREILRRGYDISFSGIITFRNAAPLREIAAKVPLGRFFTETDSPYLSPEPFRGRPNRPLRVRHVVEALARLHELEPQRITAAVSRRLEEKFGVPARAAGDSGGEA